MARARVLRGRGVGQGRAEGAALMGPASFPGWAGLDPLTGIVHEKGNPLDGKSIKGMVLFLSGSKGSTGWATQLLKARVAGTGPLAIVFSRMDSRTAAAAVVTRVPVVTDLGADIFATVKDGDWVTVDADAGTVILGENAD